MTKSELLNKLEGLADIALERAKDNALAAITETVDEESADYRNAAFLFNGKSEAYRDAVNLVGQLDTLVSG